MIKIRLFLGSIALVSLAIMIYGAFCYPILKLDTPRAIRGFEAAYIDVEAMTPKERESYELKKGWILGNDRGLKRSANIRLKLLYTLGVFNVFVFGLSAIFMKKISIFISNLVTDKNS